MRHPEIQKIIDANHKYTAELFQIKDGSRAEVIYVYALNNRYEIPHHPIKVINMWHSNCCDIEFINILLRRKEEMFTEEEKIALKRLCKNIGAATIDYMDKALKHHNREEEVYYEQATHSNG